jgi:hypothetical protein
MKSRLVLLAGAVALVSCGSGIRVSTMVAPSANLSGLSRFRVLTPPERRDGRREPYDPMLVNSITNNALHADLEQAFRSRGYTLDPLNPDFNVAYYSSAREKLDVTMWDYGYRPRWGGWGRPPGYTARPFTEGTLIVDVVNAKTNELLWRGRATAEVSDDLNQFQKDLGRVASEIVKKFPTASMPIAARGDRSLRPMIDGLSGR